MALCSIGDLEYVIPYTQHFTLIQMHFGDPHTKNCIFRDPPIQQISHFDPPIQKFDPLYKNDLNLTPYTKMPKI